ncbi:MAG TPA: peptidoglycan-binding domain-containing protein [Candidatus Acidoferrales bacterium]|nr:peptidoglycan-binding domain-containing protein [Candidatus Acidoferrales bacterium]
MRQSWVSGVVAGTLFLALLLPAWAAEEKAAAPKEEKMEKAQKAEPKASARGSEETKKLQEALKAKGQDPGPIDGVMGPKTRAALKAFQEASGLKGTGRLDDQTAEKLGVEKPKAMAKETKKETKEPMAKEKKM